MKLICLLNRYLFFIFIFYYANISLGSDKKLFPNQYSNNQEGFTFAMVDEIDKTTTQPLVLSSPKVLESIGEKNYKEVKKDEFRSNLVSLKYDRYNQSFDYKTDLVDTVLVQFDDISSFNFWWMLESGISYRPFVNIGMMFIPIQKDLMSFVSGDSLKLWKASAGMVYWLSEHFNFITSFNIEQQPFLSLQTNQDNFLERMTLFKLKFGLESIIYNNNNLSLRGNLIFNFNPEVERADILLGIGYGVAAEIKIRYQLSDSVFTEVGFEYMVEKTKINNNIVKSDVEYRGSKTQIELGTTF